MLSQNFKEKNSQDHRVNNIVFSTFSPLFQDRLQRDGRRLESDDGMVEVVERRLQIGVHNGWTYTDEVEMAHMISATALRRKSKRRGHQRTPSTGSVGNEAGQNSLHAKNPVEVAIPVDTAFAVVFLLEYVVAEPRSQEDRRVSAAEA